MAVISFLASGPNTLLGSLGDTSTRQVVHVGSEKEAKNKTVIENYAGRNTSMFSMRLDRRVSPLMSFVVAMMYSRLSGCVCVDVRARAVRCVRPPRARWQGGAYRLAARASGWRRSR
jgi:hypothetical protein